MPCPYCGSEKHGPEETFDWGFLKGFIRVYTCSKCKLPYRTNGRSMSPDEVKRTQEAKKR